MSNYKEQIAMQATCFKFNGRQPITYCR